MFEHIILILKNNLIFSIFPVSRPFFLILSDAYMDFMTPNRLVNTNDSTSNPGKNKKIKLFF
jgi:hypothetical protein